MTIKYVFLITSVLFFAGEVSGQILYQRASGKDITFGSYGRIGVDWSFQNQGSIGRRLNLNNMGSIGGRMEEQDYLEFLPAFHFQPKKGDSTEINVQLRMSLYSTSLSLFGNSSTVSLGGLAMAIPEMYVEARNINGSNVSVWVGARLYRGPDVHIADHWYFNDHSGQGFGVEFKSTRFATVFVSSTDTTADVPPYFYLNIKTGTPSAALRQRLVMALEHDFRINKYQTLHLLGEYHRLGNADEDNIENDTTDIILNYPSDHGWVLGVRHISTLHGFKQGSFNQLAVRYGTRIANGGDGGLSKTWLTFGAPDLNNLSFAGAYSLSIVEHFLLNFSDKFSLNGYLIYTKSKGGAGTNGESDTYYGRKVFNSKEDLTIGSRGEIYISDYFHFLTELHYSQRRDGTNPMASYVKMSLAPVLVPTGIRDTWARPHLRFVFSLARYNDYAKESLYSPWLQFAGEHRWGYYMGVKAEWWIGGL